MSHTPVKVRLLTRCESIITQLVFEHSLRIRLKSPSRDASSVSGSTHDPHANMIGKINTLITSDMQTILEARNWVFFWGYVPIQLALSTWFLYVVLGWRSVIYQIDIETRSSCHGSTSVLSWACSLPSPCFLFQA